MLVRKAMQDYVEHTVGPEVIVKNYDEHTDGQAGTVKDYVEHNGGPESIEEDSVQHTADQKGTVENNVERNVDVA